MQTVKTTLIILICIALLGACGLKGPLYLPDESPTPSASTEQGTAPDSDEKDKKEDTEKNNGQL